MRFGIALPQYGPATAEGVTAAAAQAEELGFDDVWVGDHLGIPDGVPYPPSFLFEAMSTLAFVAAVTSRVRLGAGVLVLPYRHPLLIAKQTATIDRLSGGRLVLGVGAGFLEGEFAALGVDHAARGPITDEYLDALLACWRDTPASYSGRYVDFHDVRVKPQPERPIPVWGGGSGERALRRAIRCDGWQGARMSPHGQTNDEPTAVAEIVRRLRSARPEESFTISMRVNHDALTDSRDTICREIEAFGAAGVQHIVCSPTQRRLDDWLRSSEAVWDMCSTFR